MHMDPVSIPNWVVPCRATLEVQMGTTGLPVTARRLVATERLPRNRQMRREVQGAPLPSCAAVSFRVDSAAVNPEAKRLRHSELAVDSTVDPVMEEAPRRGEVGTILGEAVGLWVEVEFSAKPVRKWRVPLVA